MHQYLAEFITVAVLHLLAVMSPGPDFVMITRSSLVYGRRSAVLAAVGLALGIMLHITYSLAGIGLIIARSITIFSIIKLLGAGYLIYIGLISLGAHAKKSPSVSSSTAMAPGGWASVRLGFLTNALNPKATLFFLALFTQVIHPQTPLVIKLLYGGEMSLATFAWFALVGSTLSYQGVRRKFFRFGHWLERTTGAVLIALGVKVAFSRSR